MTRYYRTIGKCSLCGGPVQAPVVWESLFPPTAECFDCHALGDVGTGPVITMKPAPRVHAYTDTIVKPIRE